MKNSEKTTITVKKRVRDILEEYKEKRTLNEVIEGLIKENKNLRKENKELRNNLKEVMNQ